MNRALYQIGNCELCNNEHLQYNDGFEYLDCIRYYRDNKEPKEIKEARESKVEIWDVVKKVWVHKEDFYNQ